MSSGDTGDLRGRDNPPPRKERPALRDLSDDFLEELRWTNRSLSSLASYLQADTIQKGEAQDVWDRTVAFFDRSLKAGP